MEHTILDSRKVADLSCMQQWISNARYSIVLAESSIGHFADQKLRCLESVKRCNGNDINYTRQIYLCPLGLPK